MKRVFFISDAHLGFHHGEAETRKVGHLLAFFEHVSEKGNALFLLGDLFDFWFEYRSAIPRRYLTIVAALKHLVDSGVSIQFFIGNHDFGAGRFFEDELGIPVHTEPTSVDIQGKRLYLAHGDGLLQNDRSGRFLKAFLRNPLCLQLYRMIHPDVGFAVADFFSKLSRNHRPVNNRDDEYVRHAKALFNKGIDYVIVGHTHQPFEYREDSHAYLNTGDWMAHFSYILLQDGEAHLEFWPTDSLEK
jgi:UDP-2,3-diacylglucosamine hydrolase